MRLGRASVNTIEVLEGLAPGDEVVLSDMSAWDRVRPCPARLIAYAPIPRGGAFLSVAVFSRNRTPVVVPEAPGSARVTRDGNRTRGAKAPLSSRAADARARVLRVSGLEVEVESRGDETIRVPP